MSTNTIELKLPKPSATWTEKLEPRDDNYPPRQGGYLLESIRHSPGGRFTYFQLREYVIAVDTLYGKSFKLDFETEDKDNIWYVEAVSEDEAAVFKIEQDPEGHRDPNFVTLFATRFQFDYVHGRMRRLTDWTAHLKLYAFHDASTLEDGKFLMIAGQIKDESGGFLQFRLPSSCIWTFDLEKMALLEEAPIYVEDRNFLTSMVLCGHFPTKYNGKYYSFLNFGQKMLGDITEIYPTNQTKKVVELQQLPVFFDRQNLESCLSQARLNPLNGELLSTYVSPSAPDHNSVSRLHYSALDGSWRSNLFYAHLQLEFAQFPGLYFHNFAALNLDTMTWTQINISGMESTRIPLKMTVTGNDQILLVETTEARYVYPTEKSISEIACVDVEAKLKGEVQAKAYRIPLRRPEPLLNLAIASTGQNCPQWRELFRASKTDTGDVAPDNSNVNE